MKHGGRPTARPILTSHSWLLTPCLLLALFPGLLVCSSGVVFGAPADPAAAGAYSGGGSCVVCHSDQAAYAEDVHAQKGFDCTSCHGGDASLEDEKAMSPAKGFRGKVARTKVPELCGSCHSDANFMRNYAPRMRVDQVALYKTSVHGRKLAAGDTSVATCIDCHGVHGIRPVSDPRASTYPLRQPETCGACHQSGERTDYEQSVHWELLSKQREMAAPACATCHGSHGATPPNVASVAAVCGTCHLMPEELFQKSPHGPAFRQMGLGGCAVCHDNHKVTRTSDAMVGDREGAVCLACHNEGDAGLKMAASLSAQLGSLRSELETAAQTVHQAEIYGMEVSDARLELVNANQALVQARVLVHGLDAKSFGEQIEGGRQVAKSAYAQGVAAIKERDVRRQGLLFSIGAILLTMAGLYFTIRIVERNGK